jgi:hypothetical protein
MDSPELICQKCRRTGSFTAPVSVVLVFAHGLPKPYPLVPDGEFRVCGKCEGIYKFIERAVGAHPATSDALPWTRAIVLFQDGQGIEVTPERRQIVAMA